MSAAFAQSTPKPGTKRAKILDMLIGQILDTGEIARRMAMTRYAALGHLRALEDRDLIITSGQREYGKPFTWAALPPPPQAQE